MTVPKLNPKIYWILGILLYTSLIRIFNAGHSFANFTPLGGMALFSGTYLNKKWQGYAATLGALWISDIMLNYFFYFHKIVLFYEGFFWVYASFAIMVMLGTRIRKPTFFNVVFIAIVASLAHYVISDFGVWIGGTLYPLTRAGLVTCYIAAIPFLKNMLMANLFYGLVFYGTYALATRRSAFLRLSH